jgi:uncharacterized membrane-anchored protein YitT (DUF2179 family)
MNPIFQQIIIRGVNKGKTGSKYESAKAVYRFKIDVKRNLKDALFIILGIFSAAVGLKSFLLPNNFLDGGAMGISLLINEVSGTPLSILILLVNLPFILLAIKQINKVFAIKTFLAISFLALAVAFMPLPVITSDKLLIAVFGGFFLGAGIGLSVRGGAVIDGTEVLAIYISRKSGATIGDVILIFNICIFSVAAYLFSIEIALYAILTYFSAARTVDFIIEGIEEYTGVTIISIKHTELQEMITSRLGRGVTIYRGKGGYGKRGQRDEEIDILYTVVTRLEISGLNNEIAKIDPYAFVVMNSIKDSKGGMIKKRPLEKH